GAVRVAHGARGARGRDGAVVARRGRPRPRGGRAGLRRGRGGQPPPGLEAGVVRGPQRGAVRGGVGGAAATGDAGGHAAGGRRPDLRGRGAGEARRAAHLNPPSPSAPLRVNARVPAANAVDVPLDATVSVTFNQAVNASTVVADNFTLTSGADDALVEVPGDVAYDAASHTATFTPADPLL